VINVGKQGTDGFVLEAINLEVRKYQNVVVAGETGSGKSTLLKIIAGLVQPDIGEVYFDGEKVKGADEQLVPGHPSIAYLSQHFDLQKFLRVEQVLEYANHLSDKEATAIFSVCRINHLLHRKTDQLSGGEKQRIAIARLLISKPKLLLLDEPYSNLDTVLKGILKSVIHDIGRKLRITCVLVSHDPDDTLPWANEVIVLKDGRIVQLGSAEAIYQQPVNGYVAGLFGAYNVIDPSVARILGKPGLKQSNLVRPEDIKVVRKQDLHKWKVEEIYFYGNRFELKLIHKEHILHASVHNKNISQGDWVDVRFKYPGKLK
jgi:ABC-type sugar transport system ATPase subunit